jgi:hypothetical protein
MRFAGLKHILRPIFNFNCKLVEVRYHYVIMAVGGEDEHKKYF